MKPFLAIVVLFLCIGCVQTNPIDTASLSEEQMHELMEEAEQGFAVSLTTNNAAAVYPQTIIVSAETGGETWPAFFNGTDEERTIAITASCFPLETDYSAIEYAVFPHSHRSFAVKVLPSVQKGRYPCTVSFLEGETKQAEALFIVRVE